MNAPMALVPGSVARPAGRRGAPIWRAAALLVAGGLAGGMVWLAMRPVPPPSAPIAQRAVRPLTVPQPKPASSPADVARRLDQALAKIDCALVRTAPKQDGVDVTGIGGGDGAAYALRLAARDVPAAQINWDVRLFEAPFCPALAAIRPAWQGGALALALRDQPDAVLHRDMLLQPVVGSLDFTANIRVDDLQADGTVVHIYPRTADRQVGLHRVLAIPADPPLPLQAGATLELGRKPRPVFQVEPPFGTDLLIAVATAQALRLGERPNLEPAGPYLAALHAALAQLSVTGARMAAAAMAVETTER